MKYKSLRNSMLLSVVLAFLCIACCHADDSFDAAKDAETFRQILRRRDKAAVVEFLACRSNEERSQIAAAYGTPRELLDAIQVTLSGDFEDLVLIMMKPLQQYYAETLNHEASSLYCWENVVLDIVITASNDELKAFKKDNPNLVHDLAQHCKGAANATTYDLFNGARNESQMVDLDAAKADAQLLYQLFEDESRGLQTSRWFEDQFLIKDIFVTRSFRQLRKIFKMYKRNDVAGHSIETAIDNYQFVFPTLRRIIWAIYNASRSKPNYFAARLYDAMRPIGTNTEAVSRIFAGRTEIDLKQIEKAYNLVPQRLSLTTMIRRETSGYYEDMLLAMLECNRQH